MGTKAGYQTWKDNFIDDLVVDEGFTQEEAEAKFKEFNSERMRKLAKKSHKVPGRVEKIVATKTKNNPNWASEAGRLGGKPERKK